jgi:hypothetical protein
MNKQSFNDYGSIRNETDSHKEKSFKNVKYNAKRYKKSFSEARQKKQERFKHF